MESIKDDEDTFLDFEDSSSNLLAATSSANDRQQRAHVTAASNSSSSTFTNTGGASKQSNETTRKVEFTIGSAKSGNKISSTKYRGPRSVLKRFNIDTRR
jgi:hypothetical protein